MPKKKPNNSSVLAKRASFSYLQVMLVTLLFGAMGVLIIFQSMAAPGGGRGGGKPASGSSTIGMAMVIDKNSDGLPNFNDTVTFNVATTVTDKPWVNLKCYQNNVLVAESWRGYFEGSLDTNRNYNLASGKWVSGAAECTAYLKVFDGKGNDDYTTITSMNFHVNP